MFGKKQSTSQVVELQEQLSDSQARIETLMEEMASYKQTIASFPGVKQSYDAKLAKLEADYKAKVKELESSVKATELSVNQKVNESLACIGVTNFPAENTLFGVSNTSAEIMEKFNSLQGVERTEFYRKHKEVISRALSQPNQ